MEPESNVRIATRAARWAGLALGAALLLPGLVRADKKNPTSKFYVADVDGDAQIDTGDRVDDLNKKSVYNAQGTVIETKPKAANAMVFSNGTGIFFDQDTRVEVRKFDQEPFVPNRTDMDVEPSISQTQAYVPRGTVGLCTSKLVAGSKMTYRTPLGSVNIRTGKVVIQSSNGVTKISLLSGESTVQGGNVNTGGQALRDGQQAVITPNPSGGAPKVTIQPIPADEKSGLEGKVTMACTAKKTVYFSVATGKTTILGLGPAVDFSSTPTNSASTSSSTESTAPATTPITAFDGDSANTTNTSTNLPTGTGTNQTIVATPVVPTNLPVQFTVSPAVLTSSTTATP